MPKNIENALNEATEYRLKAENSSSNEFYGAIKVYQQKFNYAYLILRNWIREA